MRCWGLAQLLGVPVQEINSDRDPLFVAVRRLPRYLSSIPACSTHRRTNGAGLAVGLVFDGDSDRIAAVDGQATFISR